MGNVEAGLSKVMEGLEERRAETIKNSEELEGALKEIGSVKSRVEDDVEAKMGNVEAGLSKVMEGLEERRAETSKQSEALSVAERDLEKQQKVLKAIQVAYNDILDRHNKLREIIAQKVSISHNNNTLNITNAQVHKRLLSKEDLDNLVDKWIPKFKINASRRAISYTAHKICLLEDRLNGRLATTITAMLLRLYALKSLKKKNIKVLEIGGLFGLNTIILNEFTRSDSTSLHFTIIDPLKGYYEDDIHDPQTGVPVSKKTMECNFSLADISKDQYRIIQGLSQDSAIAECVKNEKFDYILIDGDHTFDGVLKDYKIYSRNLRKDGLLVFDDFEAKEWPDIEKVVDVVKNDDNDLEWIGGEWRTGFFRKTN